MSLSSKESKLQRIIRTVHDESITAYEFGQNTTLTEFGVSKILKGEIKKPHESTLREISEYLNEKAQISIEWLETGQGPKKLLNVPSEEELGAMSKDVLSAKMDEIAVFIAKNEEAMFKNEIFNNLVERKAYELAIKIIKKKDWKK